MDWRVLVIDENRFCVAGTMDLTFVECEALASRGNGYVRIPHRLLENIGSFEVAPQQSRSFATLRGEHFYRQTESGQQSMLHVVVRSGHELDSLRSTGRFREWDADLRVSEK